MQSDKQSLFIGDLTISNLYVLIESVIVFMLHFWVSLFIDNEDSSSANPLCQTVRIAFRILAQPTTSLRTNE